MLRITVPVGVITVVAFNFVGGALQDAFDVRRQET
jgi:ABC-type dipeptide/oligopeptide/nickel transport system permease subunit